MCGIAGALSAGRMSSSDRHRLERMAGMLTHRGPDASGFWGDDDTGIALAHRRLSVIDVSAAGSQPMSSASGRHVLSFNGEIYNYVELRAELGSSRHWRGTSDTEVLLEAIERWGLERALERVDGMFAFALWDRREQELALVRDRLGEKPLFWYSSDVGIWFASELTSLLEGAGSGRMNMDALDLYFELGYVPAPLTMVVGVEKVVPGGIVRCRRERHGLVATRSTYWQPSRDIGCRDIDGSGGPPLEDLLRRAVQRRTRADVPVGAFLSGGVDSTVVTSLMTEGRTDAVKTFSVGFPDQAVDESTYAQVAATALGTEHHALPLTDGDALGLVQVLGHFDEPVADASALPMGALANEASRHVTVCLTGDAGDELFGGYKRYGVFDRASRWSSPPMIASVRLVNRWLPVVERSAPRRYVGPVRSAGRLLRSYAAGPGDGIYVGLVTRGEPYIGAWSGHDRQRVARFFESMALSSSAPIRRAQEIDLQSYLPGDILAKVDRTTMAASIESRIPLLDRDVLRYAFQLPPDVSGKDELRAIAASRLPPGFFDRPKAGFTVPLGRWLRGPLRGWADDLLSAAISSGLVDSAVVRSMWRSHLAGRQNWDYRLWDVIALQVWLERGLVAD